MSANIPDTPERQCPPMIITRCPDGTGRRLDGIHEVVLRFGSPQIDPVEYIPRDSLRRCRFWALVRLRLPILDIVGVKMSGVCFLAGAAAFLFADCFGTTSALEKRPGASFCIGVDARRRQMANSMALRASFSHTRAKQLAARVAIWIFLPLAGTKIGRPSRCSPPIISQRHRVRLRCRGTQSPRSRSRYDYIPDKRKGQAAGSRASRRGRLSRICGGIIILRLCPFFFFVISAIQ